MLKKLTYLFGALALAFGLWGFYNRFAFGHENAAYGSYVVWGLWVAMYLFFAGCAAGGFMVATLDLLFQIKVFKGTGKAVLWAALVCLGAALLSIWLDLGHLERVWKVYLEGNPRSLVFQMVWGYTIFGVILLITLYLAIYKPQHPFLKVIMWIGLVVALFISGAVARALIIFPGLTVPELDLLTTAFSGPHLSFDYFPSLMEWAVTAGTVGLAILGYLLGIDYLPLFPKSTKEA